MLSRLTLAASLLTFTALGETPAKPSLPAPDAPGVITQKNKVFVPAEIIVKVGDSLTFVNADLVTHNVFSRTSGLSFNLKLQRPGKTAAVPFAAPGTAEVRCAFHPTMKLKVVVR